MFPNNQNNPWTNLFGPTPTSATTTPSLPYSPYLPTFGGDEAYAPSDNWFGDDPYGERAQDWANMLENAYGYGLTYEQTRPGYVPGPSERNAFGQPLGTIAPYGNTFSHPGPAYFSGYATARDFNRMGTTLEEELAGKRKPKVSYSGAWKGDKDNPFEGGNPFQGRWGNKKKKIGKGKPKGSGNTPGWVGEMAQFNV
jgi:hypothetical protein